jgi:hypothetical protein
MTVDLNKIKNRILAMSAKTVENGCTEDEAMAAIAMVGKLLQQYNLSMDEVELRAEVCDTLKIDTGSKVRNGVYYAVLSIAGFTGCKVWTSRGATLKYCFFGQESDLLMAKYLYDIITAALVTETAKFKKTREYKTAYSKKGATSSFGIGMANRIATRLNEMKAAMVAEERAARGGSNALIVLKNQVVEDAYRQLGMRLKSNYSKTSIRDGAAYNSGQAAGDRVNLSRPVNGPGGKVLRIAA